MSEDQGVSADLTDREARILREIRSQTSEVIDDRARLLGQGRSLGRAYAILLVTGIAAATIAGATAIPNKGSWHWIAVAAGFASAIIVGASKALNWSSRSSNKYRIYNALGEVLDGLRRLERDVGYTEYGAIDERLAQLQDRRREIAELERIGEDQALGAQGPSDHS